MSAAPAVSVARVPTGSASRYLQQLASHWSHKMTVTFTAEEGTIDFPNGTRLAMRAAPDTLDIVLTVPAGEDEARMRQVVSSHLDRFAFREAPLTFDWREGDRREGDRQEGDWRQGDWQEG